MSEPEAGSDVGALRCKAVRENGGYVINGQKTWISEAHFAEHILLVCRTDDSGNKHEGLTMLSVPQGRRGRWRSAASRRWAAASSTTSSSPTARCPPRTCSASRARPGCS